VSVSELQALDQRWLMPTYKRAPVEFVRGEGARLWDVDGKRYLDFFAGLGVMNAGHCHPVITEAIREQAGKLVGVSNLYLTEPGMRFAERLVESSLGGHAFLSNSGAEANEAAIKLSRKHARARGVERPEIVVLEAAFHGRTVATLTASPKIASPDTFGPLPAGFVTVPREDAEALDAAVGENTAAVFVEPIQGEAGVHPILDEVLAAARGACDRSGSLLVFDEIQTGMGRTGSLWAWQQGPVRPDVMTAAKALGGGLPVGACIAAEGVDPVLVAGEHGSTFAAAPLASVAALAALEVIDDPDLLRGVRDLGARLAAGLGELDAVVEVRGRGLMLGARLGDGVEAAAVAARALDAGLVVNVPAPDTLRLLPPLVIGEAEVDEALELLAGALD
jgi:predicted acetylornithine/succinylornithine family transaminase